MVLCALGLGYGYLNAFLDAHSGVEAVEEYIDGWMADNVAWADGISPI